MKEVIDVYRKIGGFQALHVVEAADILKEAVRNADLRFFSFTANLVATGLREIIADAIRRGLFNVVVTTAGALDHDIAKAEGARYVPASFDLDDVDLADKGYHRLGNLVLRRDEYGPYVERFVFRALDSLEKDRVGTFELAEHFGKLMPESSILGAAARAGVKVFVPGIVDGAVGTAILTYNDVQRVKRGGRRIVVDVLRDEEELRDLVASAKSLAALIVGGGISKHHVIWWAQFKGGLDYVVYITTATEYDGSLSGARPREAITWGKVKRNAKSVHIMADATLVLPILLGYL
ncbi:putative deoxyhypusine synthase [Thermoproteus uzoniensis 768-20]|uniref:Deoxyhypusine synthase n=1 Tax=Thermoproteus uzoniensis (strain 768-20) TaxID=999630 RepID=F2L2T0_THEU7|nr:deoxyhypusine synthase [Thermoproteus uzoniensis]AEA11868.1 putative deoxyhypusine synthase [Thermoproteus uzoniensis 768-20]